jgi:hypothetical protein
MHTPLYSVRVFGVKGNMRTSPDRRDNNRVSYGKDASNYEQYTKLLTFPDNLETSSPSILLHNKYLIPPSCAESHIPLPSLPFFGIGPCHFFSLSPFLSDISTDEPRKLACPVHEPRGYDYG